MEIFSDYLIFKLFFDNDPAKNAKQGRKGRCSLQSSSGLRGSCVDVSQVHRPLRRRLLRRRSGSWTGPLPDEYSSISAPTDVKIVGVDKPKQKEKSSFKKFGCFYSFANSQSSSLDQNPVIQVNQTASRFEPLEEIACGADKTKEKLIRKRSGSLPESETGTRDTDRHKLAPPYRYEAPASLDPKRNASAPASSSSVGPSSHPTLSPESTNELGPGACSGHKTYLQRPLSAMEFSSPNSPLPLTPFGQALSASSSPSLLQLYLSASRRQSVQEDYGNLVEDMDSVVLDLGYHYNKPVHYMRSDPTTGGPSGARKLKARARSSKKRMDQASTPPPSRALSRASSRAAEPTGGGSKKNTLIETVMRKLEFLRRRSRTPRARSTEQCKYEDDEKHETQESLFSPSPSIGRWRLSKPKSNTMKMSPPSIFVQHMMGADNMSVNKNKNPDGWQSPTGRQFERTLSYKRSTSAPSPRFSGRAKSNATEYSGASKRPSLKKKSYDSRQVETFPSDPLNDMIESDAKARLSRCNSPLLQPGCSSTQKSAELLITICYTQTMGFITTTVNKARNVPQNSESFVRLHLFEGMKVLERKQTTAITGCDPEFKQAYVFTVGNARLAFVHILIELFSRDMVGKKKVLGNVIIGPKAGGTGSIQWLRMMKNANYPCSMWHTLSENY